MSISVIIPAYNYARFLARTLRSVLRQDTGGVPVEIIVVDDGSTDDTPEVARSFGARIQYIRQENGGLSGARNTGMAHASGTALVFLDADDLLLPGALASQWTALQRHADASLSVCRSYMVRADTPDGPLRLVGCYPLYRGDFAVHMCHANIAPVHAYMVLRRLAQEAGPFDVRLGACEDYDFWLRCLMAGGRIVGNAAGGVVYRKHTDSMSAQTENQVVHEVLCSRRVDQLLQATPSFLPQRRLDANLAHALGAVKRARAVAPWRGDLAVDMLTQCATSIMRGLARVEENAAPADPRTAGTAEARTEAEVMVLHYYVVRTLLLLRQVAVMRHGELTRAHRALSRMFPAWDVPLADGDQQIATLLAHVHEPLDAAALCDDEGVLHSPV